MGCGGEVAEQSRCVEKQKEKAAPAPAPWGTSAACLPGIFLFFVLFFPCACVLGRSSQAGLGCPLEGASGYAVVTLKEHAYH